MRLAITTALAVGLVAAARYRSELADYIGTSDTVETDTGDLEQNNDLSSWQTLLSSVDPMSYMTPNDRDVKAFLDMIRRCDAGTEGPDGYRRIFKTSDGRPNYVSSWNDHPRVAKRFWSKMANDWRWTSAAGGYQFMAVSPIPGGGSTKVNTWDRLQAKLGLPDFSPASQDIAAKQLLLECGALAKLNAGDFEGAVASASSLWESLPGAKNKQPQHSMAECRTWFQQFGGTL
jgi:muramidase (phage lysozyme)